MIIDNYLENTKEVLDSIFQNTNYNTAEYFPPPKQNFYSTYPRYKL